MKEARLCTPTPAIAFRHEIDDAILVLVPLLLALTAPREERGREIRSIAVSFSRRAGLFLRRIRVWLHHLPIKIPGGMTEYRQNDSEADEER